MKYSVFLIFFFISFDSWGFERFNIIFDIDTISSQQLQETAQQFIGTIQQQPPIYSAIHKDGKRLYEFARAGEKVDIPHRTVTISTFEITEIILPKISFRVTCSKGTYIRSLAHDFGKALNNGAYLSSLRRTKIGDYTVDDAITPTEFEENL